MASFELHVWGNAFGLESIDTECLAAVKYCSQVFRGRGKSSQWNLVESSDPSICPDRMFTPPIAVYQPHKRTRLTRPTP